ncbi:hypothetical protein [Sphingobium chlorophenolicum]|uniref:Uncharacterized protein n=1 Tax=Sphingobium chlorophenolicum TaxID=46429 RepID=A0A081RAA0_SPHCR|nr:hypothetical protein [Sphingobium chlorophenolicum]KEQ52123.1 hypothetical protein BV95_03604 [Sphingobium chlorophenolicum]
MKSDLSAPTMPRGCTLPDARLIAWLAANAPALTDEGLNDRFGISYNSWRRLMAGQPVRASLLARLERRLETEASAWGRE